MKKINLNIVGLSYSQTQSGAYALVLGEVNGYRRLPIIIGGFEAQAIAIEIEKVVPSRPLTHDLFKSFAQSYHISIQEVIIYNLVDGVFYAKVICSDQDNKTVEIDARTSDAIALAVRFECPICIYEFILATAGIVIEGSDFVLLDELEPVSEKPISSTSLNYYSSLPDEELKTKLQEAIWEEAYEKAAKIRDILSRRNSA